MLEFSGSKFRNISPWPTFAASMLKDYYRILHIAPGATVNEIKQAYRKLAQQYHPDKTGNDAQAALLYAEIREAYEVLIHPGKKEQYLQKRWYQQSRGDRRFSAAAETPELILNEVIAANRYASALNPFRTDRDALHTYLDDLIRAERIDLLNESGQTSINEEIKKLLLSPLSLLKPKDAAGLAERIMNITPVSETFNRGIQAQITSMRNKEVYQRYEYLLIIAIAITVCILIYFLAR